MKNIFKYYYLRLVVSCVVLYTGMNSTTISAQQDPMFTQYMFNTLAINPAYAGSREVLSVMLLARQQWVGFEGAPSTATLTAHSPVYNNMATGISMIYDSYGPVNQTSLFVDYAYHLKMNNNLKLSLGLKGGFSHYAVDFTDLQRTESIDDAYNYLNEKETLPNFGFGIFLFNQNFYLGLSIPRILENSFENGSTNYGDGTEIRHYYGMAGVVLHVNEWLVLRPSVMGRMAQGAPFSVDGNINSVLYDQLWLGVMYRLNESFGGIVQYQFSSQIKVGYAFDLNTNELSSYHSGTHEIMINYEFNFNKERVLNPRYF